ncbi:MAG: lysophospholipid acyltransferase family protein [Thermoanaerobaculia bacterium]
MGSGRRGGRPSRWLDRVLVALAPWIVHLHSRTLRVRTEGLAHLEERIARGLPVILAGWHQRLYLGIEPLRRFHPVIMVSLSRDGERIARIVQRLGWRPVRGSSSRGGARALATMIGEVSRGAVGVHLVDGPRGPARPVKPGLALLARRAGAAIIPVYPASRRRWEARSWDRFQVPLPFTRVLIRIDPPIEVPRELSPREQETFRHEFEKTLERGYAEADRSVQTLRAQPGRD